MTINGGDGGVVRIFYKDLILPKNSINQSNHSLMVEFISELVTKSLECLRLAEDDDASIGTADSIAKSLVVGLFLSFFLSSRTHPSLSFFLFFLAFFSACKVLTDYAQKNLRQDKEKEKKILENMRKTIWSGIGFREKRCREVHT